MGWNWRMAYVFAGRMVRIREFSGLRPSPDLVYDASVNVNGGQGRGIGTAAVLIPKWMRHVLMLGLAVAGCILSGCQSTRPTSLQEDDKKAYVAAGAQPGDTLKINFPGAPNLSTTQTVQPNGTIALPLGGSLEVRDKMTAEIEKMLLAQYGSQLVIKEVTVALESAGFPVFVSGAVLKPGRIQCTRSMTVLEVVVEAGGFIEGRANMKQVRVVRLAKDGTTRTLILDLKSALSGKASESVYVRPSDVINVPERFSFY